MKVNACASRCNFHGLQPFDGIHCGFLNFNGDVFVSLDMFFLTEAMTIGAHTSILAAYEQVCKDLPAEPRTFRGDARPDFFSYNMFRRVYWTFLHLRGSFEHARPGGGFHFCCDRCGETPDILITDGTAICLLLVFFSFLFVPYSAYLTPFRYCSRSVQICFGCRSHRPTRGSRQRA